MARINIPYFEGVNTIVEHNLSKKVELEYAENVRSLKIGSIEKRRGYSSLGTGITPLANYGLFYFESTTSNKFLYRITTVGASITVYYLNNSSVWTALTGAGTGLSAARVSATVAENCCFLVNGTDVNRFIAADGTTVTTSASFATTNHVFRSPKAFKINYYKDRLYVADYYLGSSRIKNGVMFSSKPVGIVALTSADVTLSGSPVTIDVTDTKYIYATDSLDVVRGGTKIATIAITAKTETTITASSLSANILSSDELWVANTYDGTNGMVFRWADVANGTSVKRYDSFKMTGGSNNQINLLTNIGDVMAVSHKDSFMVWNGSNLTGFDSKIGCVSPDGFIKVNNILFFTHYTGVYATTGGEPKLISSKVQDYFDGATQAGLEACAVGKKGLYLFFSIGTVTLYNTDGSTYKTLSNVVLEYNIRQENWFVHINVPASRFENYITSTDPDKIVFTSSVDYAVYDFLTGTSDNNAEIPFMIMSSDITLNKDFELISYPKRFIVETESGNTILPFVSLDRGQLYGLNLTANKGCAVIPVVPQEANDKYARCRKIRLCLKESSKGYVKISRVALEYSDTAEQEVQKS